MGKYLLILFLLLGGHLLKGQQSDPPSAPPKVGLVLSGGGAKGLAHIGALKVIEETGVHLDYIGGTSMGAIVGALYASGFSASQLDSLFRNTDLADLIQDNMPRDAKTFYEKEDSERYALTLPFNNFKLSFPQGLSSGQNIYNALVRMLYHVKDIRDFNDLQIPFFCIATNVETGKQVLLNQGYLPEAILASGTFPSLFQPAEVEEEVLIDGGVLNNYPVEELRALGAEIVIGVDVQHGLRDRSNLSSATEILLQINNFRTIKDMSRKSALTDIYIKPDMENYSVIDFEKKDSIIDTGEKVAREHLPELRELASKQGMPAPKRPAILLPDSLVINRLVLKGDTNFSRGYIKGKLRINLNEKVSFTKLQQGINNLVATGNFRTIRYELVANGLEQDLVMTLTESMDKTFLRISAHYDNLYNSAALINLTKKNLFLQDDVASMDLILGDNLRYNFQYYVDKGSYWSFGMNSRFYEFDKQVDYRVLESNYEVPINSNVGNINLKVTDLTNQIYLQTVLKEEFAFLIGAEHKLLRYSTTTLNETGNDSIPAPASPGNVTFFEKSNYLSAYGKLILDTYDDKYFPSRGLYFNGDFHLYFWSSDFNDNFKEFSIAKATMGAAFPLSPKLSVNIETEGGFKLGTSRVTSFDFVLGGFGNYPLNNFQPFLGYDFLSLPGNSYVKSYIRLDYEIRPKNHLLFAANIANVEDDIFRTGEWFTAPDYTGYGIGYGWESFFGPVQFLYSWSPEISNGQFFISLGYWF
ncbi:NTE family protein [Muriicola jejuensis]|uniref:Patatin n=1 Tax=Muriicola jejuensis TaxID=504488 RepID=A0A6P0UE67_9FLAO|nr:patatin-like phospholipase family protein [Muriicola jejuensis]NER10189.1 patatin [Muriicola jejuensis]SMP02335.1 NTE family protein [Muriicola jejuensis]